MPRDYEFMYHSDQLEQTAVCRELAPEGLQYALGQPWKALENALRNRNFENKQLASELEKADKEKAYYMRQVDKQVDHIADLEELLEEWKKYGQSPFGAKPTDELIHLTEQILGEE